MICKSITIRVCKKGVQIGKAIGKPQYHDLVVLTRQGRGFIPIWQQVLSMDVAIDPEFRKNPSDVDEPLVKNEKTGEMVPYSSFRP